MYKSNRMNHSLTKLSPASLGGLLINSTNYWLPNIPDTHTQPFFVLPQQR